MREGLRRSATSIGTFSEFVAGQLTSLGKPMSALALPSEFSTADPQGQDHGRRSDFLFMGRLSPYKGLEFLLDSWKSGRRSLPPGERLHLLASGNGPIQAGPGVVVQRGRYDESQVSLLLSRVRAVVLPYAEASQSGVQVLAMQFGVPTIVTDVGGLPEMQPVGAPVVRFGDQAGLIHAMASMVDPEVQEALAAAARHRYATHHGNSEVSVRLLKALRGVSACHE